jgi:hypothetical protein
MPHRLTETILTKFTVNGAIPVTMEDMKQFMTKIMEEMKTIHSSDSAAAPVVSNSDVLSDSNPRFNWYLWGGKMHMIPSEWILPTSNVKDIWNLWWFGHLNDKIQPYRYLTALDFTKHAQIVQLTKTRKVMNKIEEVTRQNKYVEPEKRIQVLSKEENSKLFDLAYTDLLKQLFKSTEAVATRLGQASIATIYDHINPRKRSRKRSREAVSECVE